ncbi:MAG: hypothetical protein QHG99_02430 [Methanomicrobiales archaeon]|nr:hypothetical protein [Methanomicrobiales archaeon]
MMNLLESAEFSENTPSKKDLLRVGRTDIAVVCLKEGQAIPPHPEPYTVAFVVLAGEGAITAGSSVHQERPMDLVSVGRGEDRGIIARTQMILLGIRGL